MTTSAPTQQCAKLEFVPLAFMGLGDYNNQKRGEDYEILEASIYHQPASVAGHVRLLSGGTVLAGLDP